MVCIPVSRLDLWCGVQYVTIYECVRMSGIQLICMCHGYILYMQLVRDKRPSVGFG